MPVSTLGAGNNSRWHKLGPSPHELIMVKWERQAYYLTNSISSRLVVDVVAEVGTKTCRNMDEVVVDSVCENHPGTSRSSGSVLSNRTLCNNGNVLHLCCLIW